jgi:DNA-binding PadR family transcriptional regulator
LLKRLERNGLIERNRADEDERELRVCLTDKGMRLKDKVFHEIRNLVCKIGFTAEQAVALRKDIEKLVENICHLDDIGPSFTRTEESVDRFVQGTSRRRVAEIGKRARKSA